MTFFNAIKWLAVFLLLNYTVLNSMFVNWHPHPTGRVGEI